VNIFLLPARRELAAKLAAVREKLGRLATALDDLSARVDALSR
jgi:hypothetical protein